MIRDVMLCMWMYNNLCVSYTCRDHSPLKASVLGFLCQVLLSGLIGVVSWKRPLSLVVSVLLTPTIRRWSDHPEHNCNTQEGRFYCDGGIDRDGSPHYISRHNNSSIGLTWATEEKHQTCISLLTYSASTNLSLIFRICGICKPTNRPQAVTSTC